MISDIISLSYLCIWPVRPLQLIKENLVSGHLDGPTMLQAHARGPWRVRLLSCNFMIRHFRGPYIVTILCLKGNQPSTAIYGSFLARLLHDSLRCLKKKFPYYVEKIFWISAKKGLRLFINPKFVMLVNRFTKIAMLLYVISQHKLVYEW